MDYTKCNDWMQWLDSMTGCDDCTAVHLTVMYSELYSYV